MRRDKKIRVVLKAVEERPKPAMVTRLHPEVRRKDVRPSGTIGEVKKISEILQHEKEHPKENRPHHPDIEALIDQQPAHAEDTEQTWGDEKHSNRTYPWGWFVLGGAALVGAITWSLMSVKKSHEVAETIRIHTAVSVVDEAAEQREAENLVNNIETALRSYFAAASIESRLQWVRFPERVEPMMRTYAEAFPQTPSPLQTIRVLQPLPIEHQTQFWMASVELAKGERRELLIECMDKGPRIDWETMVCYQPMPWDEFAARNAIGKSLDFRLYVEPSSFYSHEFRNEAEWACYRLSAPNAEQVMFGYVRRGTELDAELSKLTNDGRRVSLILRLQIPPSMKSPMGVVIENLMSPRWLHLTLPEE
jgi:hypothetical protein